MYKDERTRYGIALYLKEPFCNLHYSIKPFCNFNDNSINPFLQFK